MPTAILIRMKSTFLDYVYADNDAIRDILKCHPLMPAEKKGIQS